MPPGHAKSTYASVLFPAWYLGRNPGSSVIAASHTANLAEYFGRKVRNIVAGDKFHRVFRSGLAEHVKAAGRWETKTGGEYLAVGVGGGVTGRRADLAIIDDPVKGHEQADSEIHRNRIWEWYQADLRTRLKPGGAVVLIQTRWHEDDLAGRLLARVGQGGERWEVLNLPALAENDDPLGRTPGEALWPDMYGKDMLDALRRDIPPRYWTALYQQCPASERGDYFQRDWVRWYDDPPRRQTLRIYGASDYAVTAAGGDYTVHGIVGLDPDDNLFVLDWWRAQTDSERWIEAFIHLVRQWRPVQWGEEKGQIEKSLGPFIDKRQRETGAYCLRMKYTNSTDKATRAQAIRGRMAQGKVYLPRNAAWSDALVSELLHFPTGKHDDQVDVLSLFGRMLSDMRPTRRIFQTLADDHYAILG